MPAPDSPTEPAPPQPAKHDAYAAFRVPAFVAYQLGAFLLQMGTAAQTVAISWEIYARTDDPFLLGLVGLVQAIPMLVLTLPAGYLADVFDRKALMIVSLIGATLTSLGLAATSHYQGSLWLMYLILFFDSCALRLGWPARQALLPALVPADVFENAVKWRSTTAQLSGVLGPAIGGFFVAWSLPAAYLLCAATSSVYILLLARLAMRPTPRQPRGQMFRQVAEGLRFVWRQKILLATISLDLFAVLLGGAVFLLPVFARDVIDLSGTGLAPEQALGWLRAAPAAGALVAALALAHLPPMQRAGRTMLICVAGFGVATIVFGFSTNFWLSLAMLALTGLFDNVSVVVRHTLVQLATPDHMRGRVSSVNAIFIGSSNELGGFESGLVAAMFTPVVSVVSGGIGTLVIVAAWAGLFPGLRRLGSFSELQTDETTPIATAST